MTEPHPPQPSTDAEELEAPAPPPGKVAALAAERGLGQLIAARAGSNPIANFGFGLLAAAVLVGLGILVGWLAGLAESRLLAFLALACMVFAAVVAVYAVMALLAGFTGSFIYDNGLVQVKNGRHQAVTWAEVDQLLLWRAGGSGLLAGRLLAYYVRTFDGRKIPVEAKVENDVDRYGDLLRRMVAAAGRPVVESGPAAGVMKP